MSEVMINVRTKVRPNEILFCEADINYTRIYYQNRVEMVAITLKSVEKMLGHFPFFRIHRSYLVNLQHILENTDKFEVEMTNNRSLTISRRKVGEFRRVLKKNRPIIKHI